MSLMTHLRSVYEEALLQLFQKVEANLVEGVILRKAEVRGAR